METDVIIQFGIFFFCIALLTFWFKKRWKKKPEQKARSYPENEAEGKWNKSKDMSSSEDWVVGGFNQLGHIFSQRSLYLFRTEAFNGEEQCSLATLVQE